MVLYVVMAKKRNKKYKQAQQLRKQVQQEQVETTKGLLSAEKIRFIKQDLKKTCLLAAVIFLVLLTIALVYT